MKLSSTLFACTMTLSLVGCAGRTAYWEAKPSAAADAAAADVVADAGAEEAWAGRGEEANVRKAIAGWEGVLGCEAGDGSPESRCKKVTVDASTVKVMSDLTHAYYFLADAFLRDKEDAYLTTMDRGVWWGERALAGASPEFAQKMADKAKFYEAIKVVPAEGIEAMYWYAACLGKWAKRTSFAVLLGQKDNIKATMERVLELDPDFFHGAAHRYFGAYYAIAPGFAGGDPKKSEEHFAKSLEKAPYYLGTKVLIAEHLATKLDDEDRFKKELQEVIDADPNATAGLEPESKIEQEKARELLDNMDEFF
jgi:tetratricopeptide (TPR) repeat protein